MTVEYLNGDRLDKTRLVGSYATTSCANRNQLFVGLR